jgi:hypothetical protein
MQNDSPATTCVNCLLSPYLLKLLNQRIIISFRKNHIGQIMIPVGFMFNGEHAVKTLPF